MPKITPRPLPDHALLAAYRTRGHTDCLTAEVPRAVTLGQYITAFYTSPAFRPEQWLLRLVGKPSTAADVAALAAGAETFAAWEVEARAEHQLLLRDFMGRTRSWLMVEDLGEGRTRLYFGSAVVRREGSAKAGLERGLFSALLGFHKIYARALLWGAVRRLVQPRHDL